MFRSLQILSHGGSENLTKSVRSCSTKLRQSFSSRAILENKNPAPEINQQNIEVAIDESLLAYTLSLTYEERLLQHERARQTIHELQNARKAIYGESEQPPENAT